MKQMRISPIAAFATALLVWQADAFVTQSPSEQRFQRHQLSVASLSEMGEQDKSYVLSQEEVNPLITLGNAPKEKIINGFGLRALAVSLVTGPIWMLAMFLVEQASKVNPEWDPNHAIFDGTGKVWAKVWLGLTDSTPTISGEVQALKEGQGPCLYVANHASWLDIPVLCTVLDPVFKFIAKNELEKVPCIGQQLAGGDHILIDRDDRRSQFRCFKKGVSWLKNGVPLMAFPEGMRSPDGKLMNFKGGVFSMATKTQVPIVPISVGHTHAVMPGNALFPVQAGRGKLHIHVHKPITTTGKSEEELGEEVRAALLSEMPFDQHPEETTMSAKQVEEKELATV
eukprot:CAMPEP_0194027430 /NCGR_PEP_ID=MMETSP0009_2-20130614/1578_1 /TAXON_ID=210454 /ORGANISM="Grammatophora oceanica, Strain CCMP 410" /LENGTH=340 /DNA_ID=CAMNT_0038666487 /DNA_START=96 /DNA_END=1118 /DNA_ORIENTATION=+